RRARVQVELPGITLVGTAHVSKESVNEVREVIARARPKVVAVELDHNRRTALVDKRRFEQTPMTDLLRSGKSSFILAQSMLASERDAYLAANIHEAAKKGSVVAVLGAGHLKGVEAYLRAPETIPDKKAFEVVPKKKVRWGLIVTSLFSLALFSYFGYLVYRS